MSAAASDPASEGSVAKLIAMAEKPTPGQRLISWASRPPGRLYIPACTVAGLVLLYEDSVPGGHLPSFLVGLGAGLLLAGMGALRLGIALAVARPMIRYYWLRWVSAPIIAALALGLSVADVPLQARVDASADDLLALANEAEDPTTIPRNGEWTGLYPLLSVGTSVGTGEEISYFAIDGAGLLSQSGLAHSPEELPEGVFVPGHGSKVYEHVSGDWYVWVDH